MEQSKRVPLWPLPAEEDCGFLEVSYEGGRGESEATRSRAKYPLKLLIPRIPLLPPTSGWGRPVYASPVWVYLVSFGGGLLAGDQIGLRVDVRRASSAVLTTQASTKVYKVGRVGPCGQAKGGSVQRLHCRVAGEALLVLIPEPVCCYKDASYSQQQVFEMESGGSLVLLDWFTSGRRESGERWAFTDYQALNSIRVDQQLILHDHMRLSNTGLTTVAERMGKAHVSGVLILLGPRVAQVAQALLSRVMPPLVKECFRRSRQASQISTTRTALEKPFFFASASPIGESGVIIRIAAESSGEAYAFVQECLRPLQDQIGQLVFTGV